MPEAIASQPFGRTDDGAAVDLFTLMSASGIELRVTNYGGIITSLSVPDAQGEAADIVLGYDDLEGYLHASPYFGAIIGRYGNRIAGGRFTLDGEEHHLTINNAPNHLHGGERGFDKQVWEAHPFQRDGASGIAFTDASPDGEEGYPGTLRVRVTYTLTDEDELVCDYEATTDQATPVNLTHHSYFNLAGHGAGDILDHRLAIRADHFTPIDDVFIPTGEIREVAGTPFDFQEETSIGARIAEDDPQLRFGLGYDHNFVLSHGEATSVSPPLAARVVEPASGRVLEVYTTEPGLQFYSGNMLDGSITGKDGVTYHARTGFCLETQHFPDAPNHPHFPPTILRPGETYRSRTVYRFRCA